MVDETVLEDETFADRTTLNSFFHKYEHLFVISGVFAALAIYLAQILNSNSFSYGESSHVALGVFAAFLLVLFTSILILFYAVDEFGPINLEDQFAKFSRATRWIYLLAFFLSFYFVLASVASIAVSLTNPLLYFLGVLLFLVFAILSLLFLSLILRLAFEEEGQLMTAIFINIYTVFIMIIFLGVIGYFYLEYRVSPVKIGSLESYGSIWKNMGGIVVFASLAMVFTSGVLGIFSLVLTVMALVKQIWTRIGKSYELLIKMATGEFEAESSESDEG